MRRGGALASVVLAASLAWAAAILLAPAAIAASHSLAAGAEVAAVAIYAAGHVVCHQRSDRSVTVAGQPMPVCARCSGLYLAFPAALLVFMWRRRGPHHLRTWLVIGALPTVLSVALEAATGVTAAPARAAAGAMLGLALARVLAAALADAAVPEAGVGPSATLAG